MKIIIHKKNLVTLLLTVSFFLANAQIRILPLGESTTCGQSNNSYRKALSDSILAYSVNFDYIGSIVGTGTGYDTDHQGMSGTPCSGLMDWVNNRSSAYNPEMILLWEGINDTGFFSKAKSTQQLRNLISTINTRWPNTEIFVSSIPNTTIDSLNKYVNALNDSMPGVVTAFQNVGVRIHFVNTIGVISTSELIDAVHPTTAAYLKMAPYWFNAIKPFFGTGNITGNVSFNSTGLAGVTLSFENRSVVTDANGNYTFYNVPNGSYTLTASLGGYSIPTAPVTMSGTTISNQNFVATLVAPSAPTSLRAVPSNNQITLTWTACTGTTGYTVKRATANGGPFTNVATNITSATYADTGLTNGTCYFYVVSASNGAGEGPNSTQVALSPTAFARPIIEFKFNDSPQFIQNTGSIGKSGFFEKAASYSANALGLTTSANDYALNLTTGGSGSFSKDSIGTALNGLTQFTATMWYKPGAIGKTGTLFNMSGVGGVRINNASGQFQFVEGLQTAWYNAPSIANVANTTNWEFIAFTYNAGVIKFFHGTPTAFTGSETLSGGSSPASLGTLSWAFRVGFNGYESLTTGSLMDNFRLYTTALASNDIQNIYNTDLAAVGGQVYTVSGTVTAGGSSISGVSVTDGARIATTDANGNYTITAVPPGTFTITPTKAGYYFTPSSQLVTVSSGNLSGKNFAATLIPTYSVSGTVTVNSTGLAGITISDGTRSAITDVSGNYTITNIPNGNYSLTPTKPGYTFTPTTLSATVNSANLTSKNFAATAISGPFISDNFDSYSPATLPTTIQAGTGWLSGSLWTAGAAGSAIVANSLTNTGYGTSGARLAITGVANATRVMTGLQGTSTIWVSFKIHATSVGQSDYISFKNGTAENFTVNPATGKWRINGWTPPSSPAINTTDFHTIYLLVNPTDPNDRVKGWFNVSSDPTGTAATMAGNGVVTASVVSFDRLVFNTWGGGFDFDDLRIGATWNDVAQIITSNNINTSKLAGANSFVIEKQIITNLSALHGSSIVTIVDARGVAIKSLQTSENQVITTITNPGMCLVQVINAGKSFTQKVLVK